jgi:CHASE2 domain-containing sensor protein
VRRNAANSEQPLNYRAFTEQRFYRPLIGGLLAVLTGVALWTMPVGEKWSDASYDYLYRFETFRPRWTGATNLVLVFVDAAAYNELGRSSEGHLARSVHAKLVNKLADDGCALVVFDVLFQRAETNDAELASALGRLNNVVLAARTTGISQPRAEPAEVILPQKVFLEAAKEHYGLGELPKPSETDLFKFERQDYVSPDTKRYPGLPWKAAELAGADLSRTPPERWLRYYGTDGAWSSLSYHLALLKQPGYFRGKTVFIGGKPESLLAANPEDDKFSIPYTRWTHDAVGGVEILATSFLNLMGGDWLRQTPDWMEELLIVLCGVVLGGGIGWFRRGAAVGVAAGAALVLTVAGVSLSYFTDYWFPWLIVVGGQVPCALAWAMAPRKVAAAKPEAAKPRPAPEGTIAVQFPEEKLPDAPEYELFTPPIGQGGFGTVWIARNAIGQWQALKAVYQAKFGDNPKPYESEFHGLQRYKPVSERHPGLLRIDLVSRMKSEGYFYYVMELGDAQTPGWEANPSSYKPRDLARLRKQAEGKRLPVTECLRIVAVLAEALEFLHREGLTHRDIKPSNVIFVNGRPKLADVGLVADIRPADEVHTLVGTPGYMPPPPERPGTPQADIYALGMVLYVIGTGRDPGLFPDLATTLMERSGHAEFLRLNAIVLKACQPDLARRYPTAAAMLADLEAALKAEAPA